MYRLRKEVNHKFIKSLEDEIFGGEAYSELQLKEMIEDEKSYIIYSIINVGEIKNLPVAYIILYDNSESLEIMKIGVQSSHRQKSYGEVLISKSKELGKNIFLEVRESNEVARNFYEKNKFTEVGKRKNYYKDPVESAIIMMWECI